LKLAPQDLHTNGLEKKTALNQST